MDVANWKKQIAPDDGMVRAAFLFLLITRQGSQDMVSHCRSGVERNDGDECGGPKVN